MLAEKGPDGGENLLDAVEADAADEMNAHFLLQAEDALGIAVEDLLHHLVLVAELLPLPEDSLVRHARVVAAKHDLVLQAAAHIDLQVAGKVLRRPAGHFPVDV